jgi:hypothetical protein
MAAARTWRWVPVFPIHRSIRKSSRSRLRGIVAEAYAVRAESALGGLHYEYSPAAA